VQELVLRRPLGGDEVNVVHNQRLGTWRVQHL